METSKEIINYIRDKHGMNDVEIASKTGFTQPSIGRIRNGKTQNGGIPLYQALLKLKDELDKKAKRKRGTK